MSLLVIAEVDAGGIKSATRHTLQAAKALGAEIHLLVAGASAAALANQAASLEGVGKVLLAEAPHLGQGLAEEWAPLVASLAPSYSHVLVPATSFGKNLLPRVAALLDVQPISDVIAIDSADTFKRPVYAGSLIATVQSRDAIKLLSIRSTAFDAVGEQSPVAVESVAVPAALGLSAFVSEALAQSERPELTAAKVVISGGRGLQNEENFSLLYNLADKLGAAVGASRAAVDAGFAPNDMQVGQTGKIVAPDVYIAVGISGAIQHLAGMKDSKVIVAINKDPDAPIFQVADYGLVADLFEAVPAITKAL